MVTDEDIIAAASMIRQGGLVAFPTETVYGLGANALDAAAVAGIFEVKGRPRFDPLIVHIAEPQQQMDVARSVPPRAMKLMEEFWPGPLSLVLEKQPHVPDIVTAGLSSVAIRCPAHDLARRLIQAAGVPVAAPSANRFGAVSPTTADHVVEQFGIEVPIVLDDGPCRIGVESTVISFVDSPDGCPTILRHGGIALEEIEDFVGSVRIRLHEESRPASPGQSLRHYSPTTRLVLSTDELPTDEATGTTRVGLLSFQRPISSYVFSATEVLSEQGCLREAAANLFAAAEASRCARLGLHRRPASSRSRTGSRHYGPIARAAAR